MNLEKCLDLGGAVSPPPIRIEPESEWSGAHARGAIPREVYDLYVATGFLSAPSVAGFESEEERLASAYFSRVMRSILECFEESDRLVKDAPGELNRLYTPLKRIRGESWDPEAARKFRATFRLLLIDLVGALDATAELVALIIPGAVHGLSAGRGSFAAVRSWARKTLEPATGIVTPCQHYAESLHAALRPHVTAVRSEDDWFELLRVYRNKVTHLGHQTWLNLGLQGDDGEMYYFLPRTWPFVPERYMYPSLKAPAAKTDLAQHLRESLVHQDMVTFLNELLAEVRATVGAVGLVLTSAVKEAGRLDASIIAAELDRATETVSFRSFERER